MAIEKQRVLDRFTPKYGTVSMPKPKLDAMSAKFALLIADGATDEDIDLFLDTMNEAHSFKEIAAEEHRKATPKPVTPKAEPAPADQPNNPATEPAEVPAWAKTLLESNKALAEKLSSFESEKQQNTIQSKVKSLIGADVPESWLKGKTLPTDPEQVEAWVSEEKQAYTAFVQENFNSSVGNARPAFGAAGTNKKEASKEEVEAVVAKMNI